MPLLIRGPGIGRQTLNHLVANVDLAPTIVELAQARASWTMVGLSLVPLLRAAATAWWSDLLLEGPSREYFGVRAERKVYVEYATGEKEQYDLIADPGQLASQRTYDQQLAARLAHLKTCSGANCR